MNPLATPAAIAAAEKEMTRQTAELTARMNVDRLAAIPERKKTAEIERVFEALESTHFRRAILQQHLEVKEIVPSGNGKIIVTLGSLSDAVDPVKLEILTSDAAFQDETLVFEFMLCPRKVKEESTFQPAGSGHGPVVEELNRMHAERMAALDGGKYPMNAGDAIAPNFNPIESQEAVVSVAIPEKEYVTVVMGLDPAMEAESIAVKAAVSDGKVVSVERVDGYDPAEAIVKKHLGITETAPKVESTKPKKQKAVLPPIPTVDAEDIE